MPRFDFTDSYERRLCLLDDVRFAHRWPADDRFSKSAGFWLQKLGGMAGAW